MAHSKAKKHRMKMDREGKWNPELNRLNWNGLLPVERRTPTWNRAKAKNGAQAQKQMEPQPA
ncbi:hypothetical protein ACHHV8_24515 [Paenibacillus sp. TAB 01]|uniref:hypothetical protein n=1 Tax=Paenibacillus sp. TAB 01 TaxID=3368988 RepID=UPI003751BC04